MPDRLKVMCVDDNEDFALTTAWLLHEAGCEVRVCQDGSDALTEAKEFQPDVCLVDILMPGMNGCELAAQLRQQVEKPPRCIALTALWDISSKDPAHKANFADHFIK